MILDFKKPQLSKTEKAITVLQTELQNLAMLLQRQIATLCIEQKLSPQRFVSHNRNIAEINNFLNEAQKADELIVNAEKKEVEEKSKILEQFKPKDNADIQAKVSVQKNN